MATVIGIDGTGGDATKEGLPHERALRAVTLAQLDGVEYELALYPRNGQAAPLLDPEEIAEPVRPIRKASLEDMLATFSERQMPIVTAFNTQEGLPRSLRRRAPGVRRIPLAAEFPREGEGTSLLLDLGGNSDMCMARDIEPPPRLPRENWDDLDDVHDYLKLIGAYHDKLESTFMPSKQYERRAHDIVNFARLGSLYMEILRGVRQPAVGLLNVGVEEGKGNSFVQLCHALLQKDRTLGGDKLNYVGFAEPEDMEHLHVIVTDGFTGNTGLKFAEKAIKIMKRRIKESFLGRIIGLFSHGNIASQYSGAYLPGLEDVIVKVHGAADARSFAAAYRKAQEFSRPVFFDHQQHSNLSEAIVLTYARRYH